MQKIKNYWLKIKSKKSMNDIVFTLQNSFNYRRKIFLVNDISIKKILMERKAYNKLKRKYQKTIIDNHVELQKGNKSNFIWVCWFQGIENAPLLVKKCFNNLSNLKCFQDKEIVLITSDNFRKYVDIPNYIIEKWHKGIITHAHFSDILRTWLLVEYGGIWIDSTVFIKNNYQIPDYFINEKLFLFSNQKRNSIINISSWYICSYSHNILLETVKKLLTEYWKNENYLMHYFLFHLFFTLACEFYPNEWKKVPKFSNIQPHILASEIFDEFNEKREKQIFEMCPIQKLSNKLKIPSNVENTFYSKYILDDNN